MRKGIFTVLFLFLLGATSAWAQAFFSTEKETFYNELTNYLNSSTSKQDRDEAATMMKAFQGVWDSYYSDAEINTVMRLCELYHAKSGAKAYANIFNFVEALQKIPTAGMTQDRKSTRLNSSH